MKLTLLIFAHFFIVNAQSAPVESGLTCVPHKLSNQDLSLHFNLQTGVVPGHGGGGNLTVQGLPLIKQSGKPFNFILARVRPNLRNNDGTAMALEALGLVLSSRMHERVIYAETFAHGKTAIDIEPQGVAATELAALWSAVKETWAEKEKVIKY